MTSPHRVLSAALVLLLAAFAAPAPAADSLQPFTVNYELKYKSMLLARMERTMRPADNGEFVFESRSTPAGLLSAILDDKIVERSRWEYADGRPRPIKYQYHHTGRSEERHVVLDFDWENGSVTNTINDDPWEMEIPDGTQDKLLYQYTMMLDMQDNEMGRKYRVADGGELKTYQYELLGEEKLRTPIGTLETIKLQRVHGSRKTVVWCAAALNYLPVRLEQYKDGRMITITMSDLEGIDP